MNRLLRRLRKVSKTDVLRFVTDVLAVFSLFFFTFVMLQFT